MAVLQQTIQPQFFLLPIIFPILHIAYGIGTYAGLLKIPFWKKKHKQEFAESQINKVKDQVKVNTDAIKKDEEDI